MARRRAWASGLLGAAQGAASGVQDLMGLQMRQQITQQNQTAADADIRMRTAQEKVASGEWSKQQGDAFISGTSTEPSVSQKLEGMLTDIGKAPTQQTVPTQEELRGRLQAKRVPLTSFGAAPALQDHPADEAANLPSTPMGPIQSPAASTVMQARAAKLRAFPDEEMGNETIGTGADLQTRPVRGKWNVDTGQNDRTASMAGGPTAGQEGTRAGVVGALTEVGGRQAKIDTAVQTENATRSAKVQTVHDEALARAHAETQGAIDRAVQSGGLLPEQVQPALKMSDDFNASSKEFYTVDNNFKQMARMARVSNQPGSLGAGDVGLMYAYMKIIDPGAAIQEGDKANVQNAGGVPEWVRNSYNKAMTGQFLTPAQRQDFLQAGSAAYSSHREDQNRRIQEYTIKANQFRIPAELITRPPAPGTELLGKKVMLNGKPKVVVDIDEQGNPILDDIAVAATIGPTNRGRTGQGVR